MIVSTNFNIGERIRELRQKQSLSQEQLALHAEITTTYLGLIERNVKNPTVKIIEKICQALHISLTEFFAPAHNSAESMDIFSSQLLSLLEGRSDEEKEMIFQLVKIALKLRDLNAAPPFSG